VSSPPSPRTSPRWFIPFWVGLASIALVAGALASSKIGGQRLFVRWWPTKDPNSIPVRAAVIVPSFLALSAFVTIWIPNRLFRAVLLTLLTLGAMGVYLYIACMAVEDFESFALLIQIVVGAAFVAAGIRTMRLFPDRKLPRIMTGIGGAGLLYAFLEKGPDSHRSLLDNLIGEGLYGYQPDAAAFGGLILLYGILGAVSPFSKPSATLQMSVSSLCKYVLLVGFPIALFRQWMLSSDWPQDAMRLEELGFLARFWLLGTGHTVLLASGLSSWAEEFIAASAKEKESGEPSMLPPESSR
jgi:hypothetical protein